MQTTLHSKVHAAFGPDLLSIREQALSPDGRTLALVERFRPRHPADYGIRLRQKTLCRVRLLDRTSGWSRLIRASLGRDCRGLRWSSDGSCLFFTHVGLAPASAGEPVAYSLTARRLLRLPGATS